MKKISLWVLLVVFTVSLARAQESATQQQLDKLSGQIQDLLDAQAQQGKRLDALAKDISELREKVNAPKTEDNASAADLKNLAEKVQEIDKKRRDDRELIIKQIENLGKVAAGAPVGPRSVHSAVSRPAGSAVVAASARSTAGAGFTAARNAGAARSAAGVMPCSATGWLGTTDMWVLGIA